MLHRSIGLALALASSASVGHALDVVFLDGFESGSTCAWSGGCPPPASVDGTWLATLDFSGQRRTLAILLHQRLDGGVVGYLLGGTPRRVLTGGGYAAGVLTLDLLLERSDGDRTVQLTANVAGDLADGTATGDLGAQPVRLVRWPEVVEERRWGVIDLDTPPGYGGDTTGFLAVALRPSGGLLAGGFAAAEVAGCLWACDGGITSFSDDGTTATFGLESDGGCSAGSGASLTYDAPSGIWLGSYTFTDCAGTLSGSIAGAPTTASRSDDAATLLAAVAGVADQLEAGAPFSAPHPSFAADFFHEGRDLAATLAGLNDELAAWTGIEVGLSRVRRISTIAVSQTVPAVTRPHGLELDESRSGVPAGGGARELYLDPAAHPFDDIHDNPLAVAGLTPAGWKLVGDHQPAFDLPFPTAPVGPADTTLEVSTPGGPVHVSLGPCGGHFGPLTGHVYGDGKPNLTGFLVADESELAELAGDGVGDDDGVCEEGEDCAYWGGLDGSLVRDRIPTYVAPHDAQVTSVVLYSAPTGNYFDDVPQWRVYMTFPANVETKLDHVGIIAPGLADAIAAASGCDPRTWESCPGVGPGSDLLEGLPPIPMPAGSPLAQPQVLAEELPAYPGYYVSGGPFGIVPWAQMEFFTSLPVELGSTEGCPYYLYPAARQDELRGVMERDMLDPASLRYRDSEFFSRWKWTAEATLCTAGTRLPADYRSLLTNLGSWYERSGGATTPDEIVSFVRMFPESAVFDPGNYGAGVQLLILRQRQFGLFFSWTMPDASVVEAFYPAGELSELDDDRFLVTWRGLGWTAGDPPAYQRAAYRLDAAGLTVRWGAFAAAAASAVQPVLAPGTPCDELEVLCYTHQSLAGF